MTLTPKTYTLRKATHPVHPGLVGFYICSLIIESLKIATRLHLQTYPECQLGTFP